MGWFELVALMKRVLPLLSRLAPMLETYVAARGATRGDSEALDRLSGEVNTHLAHTEQSHADLKTALDAQNDRLLQLSDDLQRLRTTDAETIGRLQGIEQQNASNTFLLRVLSAVTILLLLVCVCLLIVLVRRS